MDTYITWIVVTMALHKYLTGGRYVRIYRAGIGPDAIRLHDYLPYYFPRNHHRTGQFSGRAGRMLALHQTRDVSRSVSFLAENFCRQFRHGRGLRSGDGLSVRHQLE